MLRMASKRRADTISEYCLQSAEAVAGSLITFTPWVFFGRGGVFGAIYARDRRSLIPSGKSSRNAQRPNAAAWVGRVSGARFGAPFRFRCDVFFVCFCFESGG